MKRPSCKSIIQSMPYGYAMHRFVLDKSGHPCDYIFIEVSSLFETYSGLKANDIIGKRVTEVLPSIKEDTFDWIGVYSKVAYQNETVEFEQYSEALQKWFSVKAYSPHKGFFVTFIEDISEKKALAKEVATSEKTIQRQSIIIDIYKQNFLDQQSFLDYALHRALELTESQYGYIYFYNEDLEQFTLNTWTKGVLADNEVVDSKTIYSLEKTGYWGEVVRQRRPIINNQFSSPHPLKRGMPEGHVSLERFMSIPVFFEGKIVAVAGLANKGSNYTELDLNQLILLMQSVWLINQQRFLKTALDQQQHKFAHILNNIPILLSEYKSDTTLTFVNETYCKYFALDYENLIGHKYIEFIPQEEHSLIWEGLSKLTPENPSITYVHRVLRNGELRWVEWQDIAIFSSNGNPISYYSIGYDVTERRMAEEENERSLHLLNAMFDGHTAIMLLIEPESGQIYKCNQSAADFYGYTQSELCALCIQDINALNPEKTKDLRMKTASEGKRFFTFPHRLKSGEIKLVDVYSCPIIFDNMKLLFSIIFDATDRESAMKEIIYLSDHDYLTKVYNRKYFSEKYAKLDKMENYPLAVIVGDINGFKKITEENGFQIGDQVLTQFAAVLRKMIPPQGVLARISGDEFAIIIPRATESIVKTLTFQLEKEAIVETIKLVPDLCSSTLSAAFGYGIQLCVGDPLDSIMSEAETFMYRRKYYNNTSKRSQIVDAIMRALFEKSEREQKHSLRVSNISVKIAQALKLDDDTVSRVRVAGALHDIGKIGISENILNKEGPLDQSEWKIMKQHPLKSARILTGADEYSEIVPIVKSHHERFDGSGYPDGLKGENIPLESRIICIADAYDAMTVERPYRKPLNKNEAILELNRCAGTQFDPEMIAVLSLQILE